MAAESKKTAGKPPYVTDLEAAYGTPSQNGFGSAVFYEYLDPAQDLEKAALAHYQYFVGDTWERFGEEAWMSAWKQVYARQAGAGHDIVAELQDISDSDARLSVPMILDVVENAEAARKALAATYESDLFCPFRTYVSIEASLVSHTWPILISSRRLFALTSQSLTMRATPSWEQTPVLLGS